jgi:hypothetical protein
MYFVDSALLLRRLAAFMKPGEVMAFLNGRTALENNQYSIEQIITILEQKEKSNEVSLWL